MTRIISLTTTNYKRARRVEIRPDENGHLVIVSGRNGQGKSSVLDSIAAALGGVDTKGTPRPIHDGADRAEIVLETPDLVVTRTFTGSGSRLTVKSADGATYSKGQAKLDELVGKLTLDPLAFTQLSDREQVAALLDLVDLPFDLAELDAKRKTIFDERTEVGRRGKELGAATVDESLPTTETSASSLIDQISVADDHNRRVAEAKRTVSSLVDHIGDLEAELKQARADLAQVRKVADEKERDTAALREQLATIEETNAAVRSNNAARELVKRQAALRDEYTKLTGRLGELDKVKSDGLAAAEFPVDGLGFNEDGVTFQGIPFKQASSAEQIRVSLAMAIALNPSLRIIRIADGSLLDADSLALIQQQAEEHDFQVWIEMVGPREDGYVIEDGELLA